MSTALGIEPDIDLEELLRVSASDQWSIQFSPLLRGPGGEQGGTFIRAAAPWKGMTKMDSESLSDYTNRLREAGHNGVASGIESTEQIRSQLDGLSQFEGVALLRREGDVYPVPHAAAKMAEQTGNGEIISTHGSANQALDAMASRTGQRPRFPTVY